MEKDFEIRDWNWRFLYYCFIYYVNTLYGGDHVVFSLFYEVIPVSIAMVSVPKVSEIYVNLGTFMIRI